MQTFLPYKSFMESARVLDNKRLGKQRVEALQILLAVTNPDVNGWRHHPAVKMWMGFPLAIEWYLHSMIGEWCRRGFRNTIIVKRPGGDIPTPPWLGDPRLHSSHRSNLLRKLPEHYSQFGWTEPNDMPYYWPTQPELVTS